MIRTFSLALHTDCGGKYLTLGDHLSTIFSANSMEFKSTPGLSFTKVLSAEIDHKKIGKANWAAILLGAVSSLKAKGYPENT